MAEDREYAIILFGATGYTGRLTAQYLAENAPKDLKWAIAGRNENQLQMIKAKLPTHPSAPKVGVIVADSKDQKAIDAMVQSTRVILSTAGPFLLYSTPVVDACVRFGTHYVDITGEPNYIRKMIDQHHEEAVKKGVLIVSACGFDSIPADLGVHFLANHVLEDSNEPCGDITSYVQYKSAASGGTAATFLNIMDDPVARKGMGNPYLLAPTDKQPKVRVPRPKPLGYSADMKKYHVPFLMESANAKVVHRSNALLDFKYGGSKEKPLIYSERDARSSLVSALIFLVMIATLLFFASVSFLRNQVLRRVVPAPGTGQTEKQLKEGWFKYTIVTRNKKQRYVAVVKGGEPGYLETSKMVAESALCLATQRDSLPIGSKGGVVSPAVAMGTVLIDRLHKQGITFEMTNTI